MEILEHVKEQRYYARLAYAWGDTCWGVDLRTDNGDNHLGRILMQVRRELREQTDRKDEE